MEERLKYEEDIIKEIRDIPASRLPKVLKMIHFLKDEILDMEVVHDTNKVPREEGKQILLSLGAGLGDGPEDLADRHNNYLYGEEG